MAAAEWLHPPVDGITIQHLSDSHIVNSTGTAYGWALPRLDAIAADMAESGALASVQARVHTGDITEHGDAEEVGLALGWINQHWSDPTDVLVYGNHDYGNGWSAYAKDRGGVESDYGRSALTETYVGDTGSQVRILGIAPNTFPISSDETVRNRWTIPQATLDWLDGKLSADATTPTFIACHMALQEMAGVPVGRQTQPASAFETMIGDYPLLSAWLCGHYHYTVTNPNCVSRLAIADRTDFPHICGPSTAHTAGSSYEKDARLPYRSLFITYRDTDRIEVRYRDHGSRSWVAGQEGEQITVLPTR